MCVIITQIAFSFFVVCVGISFIIFAIGYLRDR